MAEEEKKQAVTTTTAASTALTTDSFMSEMGDELLSMGGAGLENITSEFMKIPFLRILQALSPQCTRGNSEYIKGAEQGMIINTLTGQLYPAVRSEENSPGILVVAVYFGPKHIEWNDRKTAGGGIKKVWGTDRDFERSPAYRLNEKTQRYETLEGSSSVSLHLETFVMTLGTPENADMGQAIISMSGTQLKKAKAWNAARMARRINHNGRTIQPPSWFTVYQLQTRFESNDQGSWYGWEITPYGDLSSFPNGVAIYQEAKALYEVLRSGKFEVDESQRDIGSPSEGGISGEAMGDDIPF